MNLDEQDKPLHEEDIPAKPKGWDYAIILLVFALTGTTSAIVPRFFMPYTGLETGFWYYLIYFLVITPIYMVLLLSYAFLFGKYLYFREVLRRMIKGVKGLFSKSPVKI